MNFFNGQNFQFEWQAIARLFIIGLMIFAPLARGAVQGWAETVVCMVVVVSLGLVLSEKAIRWEWEWIDTPFDKPLGAILVLGFISSFFSAHGAASVSAMLMLLSYILLFYLVIHLFRTRSDFIVLMNIIFSMAAFIAVFGLFKRFGLNPFSFWDYGDLKYSPDFLAATYGNHNHAAGYLEMAILLLLGSFWRGYELGKRLLFIYLTLVMLAALILTLSRGGWISTLVGIIFMAVVFLTHHDFPRKKMVAGLILGTFFLILVVLASTPVVERLQTAFEKDEAASLASRLQAWGGVLEMIKTYPWTGSGPGTFGVIFTQYQPPGLTALFTMAHNDYLHFTAELGLLFIPAFFWIAVVFYRHGFERLKHPSRLVRGVTIGAMSGITAILIHSIVDFNLHIPANAILFTVLVALVVSSPPRFDSKWQTK